MSCGVILWVEPVRSLINQNGTFGFWHDFNVHICPISITIVLVVIIIITIIIMIMIMIIITIMKT